MGNFNGQEYIMVDSISSNYNLYSCSTIVPISTFLLDAFALECKTNKLASKYIISLYHKIKIL